MAEVVVTGDENEAADLSDQAAHDAAVSQGRSEVHEQQAAEHAGQAEAAAEAAAIAAEANLAATQQAVEAGAVAEAAAGDAIASRDAILEAIGAQTSAINTLVEELQASRKSTAPPAEKKSKPSDKPPAQKRKGSWYYGG